MPVERTAGIPVFAGTINQSGVLEIRAEKIGRDTAFGRSSRRWSERSIPERRFSARRIAHVEESSGRGRNRARVLAAHRHGIEYLLNNCRNVEGRTETGAGAAAARVKHF